MNKKVTLSLLILLHTTSTMPDNSFIKNVTDFWQSLSNDTKALVIFTTGLITIGYISEKYKTTYTATQINNRKKITFADVAGNHEAKKDLLDIIEYLNNPKKYHAIGARVPKGVLLSGSPGVGKTLLARALAGETDCAFISCTGSEFIDKWVGTGAQRVRDLFKEARKKKRCIIFIDEIDSLAPKRMPNTGGGAINEYNQMINQLLAEMDGFNSKNKSDEECIIIIGATNNPDQLDSAILRPGRFDRIVHIPLPDFTSREEILKVHLKKINYDTSIDTKKIAQVTAGFSGADLEKLVNEAAIYAIHHERSMVSMIDFESAFDKITLGSQSKTITLSDKDKKVTAYHEAGHALVLLLAPHQMNLLNKITIVPQGQTLGTTHSIPDQERYGATKQELLGQITMALGGRAAEDLVFNEMTTGASSDFQLASNIAQSMICNYGMTDIIGKQVLIKPLGYYSQDMLRKIDEGVTKILEYQYYVALNLLKKNRDKLDTLAQALLEKETLYAHEVYELLNITPKQDFRLAI